MGRFVIVAYRPKQGQAARLASLVDRHWDVLTREGLVTTRPPTVMHAADGTLVEVFEWASAEAIASAHANAAVGALWVEFAQACDYVPLSQLPESAQMFAEFDAGVPGS